MEEKIELFQVPGKLSENVEKVLQEKDMNVMGNATISNLTKDPALVKKPTSSARKPLPTVLAVETNDGETRLVQKQVFHSGVPVTLFKTFRQTTAIKPFSFEERNNAAQKRKQEKLLKAMTKGKRAMEKRRVLTEVKMLRSQKAKLLKDALQEAEVLTEEIK